jgi:hypothetical protein
VLDFCAEDSESLRKDSERLQGVVVQSLIDLALVGATTQVVAQLLQFPITVSRNPYTELLPGRLTSSRALAKVSPGQAP